ncbi:MAG: hypothetical protein U5L00_09945 [Desulfovermiculus sp.]|nr:hypothetical protein [Desulfovermiculus sp.]
MNQAYPQEMNEFLAQWSNEEMKNVFLQLADLLTGFSDLELDFKARPGVSYSLRGKPQGQTRELMAMIDIIDDDPDARWLSVCFFADMITDPEERGDIVPGGLLGHDGYCFDLLSSEPEEVDYVAQRIQEAYAAVTS